MGYRGGNYWEIRWSFTKRLLKRGKEFPLKISIEKHLLRKGTILRLKYDQRKELKLISEKYKHIWNKIFTIK